MGAKHKREGELPHVAWESAAAPHPAAVGPSGRPYSCHHSTVGRRPRHLLARAMAEPPRPGPLRRRCSPATQHTPTARPPEARKDTHMHGQGTARHPEPLGCVDGSQGRRRRRSRAMRGRRPSEGEGDGGRRSVALRCVWLLDVDVKGRAAARVQTLPTLLLLSLRRVRRWHPRYRLFVDCAGSVCGGP